MEERKVASAIILNNRNEVLLQKKSLDYPFSSKGFWCLFGGGVEKDESEEEALKRELKEETNLSFDNLELFQVYNYDSANFFGKMYIFLIRFENDISKINLNEGAGFAFFSFEEINNINLNEWTRRAIKDYLKIVN